MYRRFHEEVDDKTKAAGILPLCAESGRFLLNMRPQGCYSTFGGYLCYGESFIEGAIREFSEETLYSGIISLIRSSSHHNVVKNLTYVTFLGICLEEFQPDLNEESIDFGWFSLSQLFGGRLKLHHPFENFLFENKEFIVNTVHNLIIETI